MITRFLLWLLSPLFTAWTAPYVWTTGQTVTAANLNMYISANDAYLKTYVDLISPATTANYVFAGPTSGGAAVMAARALVVADLPITSTTYTPVYSGSGGSIGATAYSAQVGRYIRIGDLIVATAYIALTNKGSWTGDIHISLPVAAGPTFYPPGAIETSNVTMAGYYYLTAGVIPSASYCVIRMTGNEIGTTNMQTTAHTTGSFLFTVSYFVS